MTFASTCIIAQNIEAKLSGNSANESFQVKDKNDKVLFSVTGDNRVSIGTTIPAAAQLIIDAAPNRIPVLVAGKSSEAAIQATNSETTGSASGIKGVSSSTNGAGILGINMTSVGVRGEGSVGVLGEGGKGIQGTTNTGIGVHAEAGDGRAVYATNLAADWAAVSVANNATTGDAIGVQAISFSSAGYGVKGLCFDGTGIFGIGKFGVTGTSDDPQGIGVQGTGATGVYGFSPTGIGVSGLSLSATGWAGYFSGRVFCSNRVSIKTQSPSYDLHVNGSAGKPGGGSWTNASDIRLKDIDGKYKKGLDEIVKLQPIRFHYKENNARGYSSERDEIGFIAQDVQKLFPESVTVGDDGYLDMNVHAINVATVNAIQDLNTIVEKQNLLIENLTKRLLDLENRLKSYHLVNAGAK
jgi:endosialidase-like protein